MENKSLPLHLKPPLNANNKKMGLTFWVQAFYFMVFTLRNIA